MAAAGLILRRRGAAARAPLGAFSYERLGEIDADLVIVADNRRVRAGFDTLTAQPLWSSVRAVAAEQVYEIDGVLSFESALTATSFLDVIETRMLA